jgi:hypothetical protein
MSCTSFKEKNATLPANLHFSSACLTACFQTAAKHVSNSALLASKQWHTILQAPVWRYIQANWRAFFKHTSTFRIWTAFFMQNAPLDTGASGFYNKN